jgi:hypothetical protein
MSDATTPPAAPDALGLYREPGVKNYLFAGLAALAMVFVVLFQRASDIGGVMLVVIGVAGLVLRWNLAPTAFLVVLTYFLVFPFGIPDPPMSKPYEIREGHFRVVDMVLVFSAVVYLACQFRIFGLVKQAVPFDSVPRKGEQPKRRPPGAIPAGEVTRLLYVAAGVVFVGQLLWLFVTGVEIDAGSTFPLRVPQYSRYSRAGDVSAGAMSAVSTRFVLLAGLLFFGTLLARLVFGYWRLRVMGPAEAAMVVQEAGWTETRREDVRLAAWRVWGRGRARPKDDRRAGT